MSKGCSKCGTENAGDARFCRHCGMSLTTPVIAPAPPPKPSVPAPPLPAPAVSRPLALWIGLGVLLAALIAGGVGWLVQTRAAALPTFDSAPPPSVLGATRPAGSSAASPATMPPAPIEATKESPAAPDTGGSTVPAGSLWEPANTETVVTKPSGRQLQAATESMKESAAKDAKAKALREQRAQAASQVETELARRRADELRARAVPPVPAAAPVPRTSSPLPSPAQARTVQERCADLNPLVKGICEARECMRREHAGEIVCQRIRAADDRRREQ